MILPREAVELLAKGSKPGFKVELAYTPKTITISYPGGTASTFNLIDAQFPDWRRVIPSEKGEMAIGVNAKYIAEIGAAIAKATGGRGGADLCMGLYIDTPDAPISITTPDENLSYVLMPMRL